METLKRRKLSKLKSAALFVSSVEEKLKMQIPQQLRIVKGAAGGQVRFTLGGKQRQKCRDSREIISGFISGHSPGPGCPEITAHCQPSSAHA